jgi:hypothetical protein
VDEAVVQMVSMLFDTEMELGPVTGLPENKTVVKGIFRLE